MYGIYYIFEEVERDILREQPWNHWLVHRIRQDAYRNVTLIYFTTLLFLPHLLPVMPILFPRPPFLAACDKDM